MGVVIETCTKYPGGPTRSTVAGICIYLYSVFHEDPQIIPVRPQRPAARGKSSGRGTGAIFTP
jgi:hypothetical protein